MRQALGHLLKLAVLFGFAYMVYDWQSAERPESDATDFAKSACLDETARRYDVSNARVYEVAKSSRGYVVRISATRTRGNPVRVACLANPHGGVTDVTIDER